MTQTLLKVGSSVAVVIPKKSLSELGLRAGDKVEVQVDINKAKVVVRPSKKLSSSDQRIARLTFDFINRYRSDLKALAQK